MKVLFAMVLFGSLASGAGVRDFNAKGDGVSKDTAAVQAAMDAAEGQGGGVVWFPAGKYLCGTIHLKSNITLELAPGAVILASPDEKDFDAYETLDYDSHADKETTYFHYALLAADGAHNISIVGQRLVDGNQTNRGGPKTNAIKKYTHVVDRGFPVQNAHNFAISFTG